MFIGILFIMVFMLMFMLISLVDRGDYPKKCGINKPPKTKNPPAPNGQNCNIIKNKTTNEV